MMVILAPLEVVLLVGLSMLAAWLLLPLCPEERNGFEDYDLRQRAEFLACCDAQGLRIAGAEAMLRGDGPGCTEVFMGSLPCALRPHRLDGQG